MRALAERYFEQNRFSRVLFFAAKLTMFEAKRGLSSSALKYIFVMAFLVWQAVDLCKMSQNVSLISFDNQVALSYVIYLFEGVSERSLDSTDPIDLPAKWLFIQIIALLLVGDSGSCDNGYCGYQDAIRGESRVSTWVSKCFSATSTTAFLYLLVFAIALLFGALAEIVSASDMIGLSDGLPPPAPREIETLNLGLYLVSLPILSIGFSLVQVMLSVLLGKVPAFFSLVVYFVLSSVFDSVLLQGDLSMAARSTVMFGSVSPEASLLFGFFILTISFILGYLAFRRKNLIPLGL